MSPIELEVTRVNVNKCWFEITMSYLVHKLRKIFISLANLGRSTVTLTLSPVPKN